MKKKIFYWALYDFANSIVLMAFLFYFSQWLVIDQGKPAWWYNAALIIASMLFIVTAPYLSNKIDASKKKIGGLRLWTALTFLVHIIVALLTVFSNGLELLTTVFYTLSIYVYLVCFLYFTPMLNDLSSNKDRSWVSGLGQAANSIGQVTGVLITLPFVNGVTLFGEPGRAQALFPAVIIFGILALPLLLWYREEHIPVPAEANAAPRHLLSQFKEVFSYKALAFMFLAYFLFSDALLTFANNFPLYLEIVHRVSDTVKSLLTASILILAALGAIVFGKVASKKGELRVLKWLIFAWIFIFPLLAFVPTLNLLVPVFLIAGMLFGPVWSISRSIVGQMAQEHLVASTYSFYIVAERFATFIGPALWSVALIMAGEGKHGYQAALLAMMVLMIGGLFALNKVKTQ